ncbi:MAG: hypothetical protein E6H10_16485 [Bacteroidetes bacterium]|nr:MAG: hypothetical protein E6H10_16485 [Bacteroidota bacterium]
MTLIKDGIKKGGPFADLFLSRSKTQKTAKGAMSFCHKERRNTVVLIMKSLKRNAEIFIKKRLQKQKLHIRFVVHYRKPHIPFEKLRLVESVLLTLSIFSPVIITASPTIELTVNRSPSNSPTDSALQTS